MTKKDNYILIYWYWQSNGDHENTFECDMEFVTDKQLEDIASLMKYYGIKQWVSDPQTVTQKTYKVGDGCLVEFRNVSVKPVKIVSAWSYKPEVVNGYPA